VAGRNDFHLSISYNDLTAAGLQDARRRRRAWTALAAGAAITAGWAVVGLPTVADALGGYANRPSEFNPPASSAVSAPADAAPIVWTLQPITDAGAKTHHKASARRVSGAGSDASGGAVCVRLCDGFFFPLGGAASAASAGAEAACASLCPDAPTALYMLSGGSDRIEDAVSPTGARYTALPVALRYRSTQDNTCTCRRNAGAIAMQRDETLRRGDAVMTALGFRVFRGLSRPPYAAQDFTALAASSLPATQRAVLATMERASVVRDLAPTAHIASATAAKPASPGNAKAIHWVGASAAAAD